MSRSEYVRRRLAQDAAMPGTPVSVGFDIIAQTTGQPMERLTTA